MKKFLIYTAGIVMKIIMIFPFLFILFYPITGKGQVIWEHEIQTLGVFQDTYPDTKLFRCEDKFFTFYFGNLQDTEQDTVEKLFRYPALISFDKNGVILFQKEEYQSIIEENAKNTLRIDRNTRSCTCSGDTLKVDIPQVDMGSRSPNIYNYNQATGNLIKIDNVYNSYQWAQLTKSLFTKKELFVLGAWSPSIGLEYDLRQNRIDVYDHSGKLLYRIILKNESFLDSISAASNDFIYSGNNSIITKYSGKDKKTSYIAKFKYDTIEVADVVPLSSISGELEWLLKFQPVGTLNYIQDFKEMDNGDIISLISKDAVIKINKDGEVISNKILINSMDENIIYHLLKIIKLKKTGYTAHFGYVDDYKRRKFVILIADENLEVVEEIKWQYDKPDASKVLNYVEDVIEDDDGNLIVLGINKYFPSIIEVVDKAYIAAIRPDYLTSVEDEKGKSQELTISPMPSSDYIQISGIENGEKIEIFDVLGNIAMETKYNGRINIDSLPIGVYYIQAGSKRTKFIKGY